jgi:hypothetical protein
MRPPEVEIRRPGGVWPRRDAIMERFMSALGNDVDAPPQSGEVG